MAIEEVRFVCHSDSWLEAPIGGGETLLTFADASGGLFTLRVPQVIDAQLTL
jgi:hypothetical protein